MTMLMPGQKVVMSAEVASKDLSSGAWFPQLPGLYRHIGPAVYKIKMVMRSSLKAESSPKTSVKNKINQTKKFHLVFFICCEIKEGTTECLGCQP